MPRNTSVTLGQHFDDFVAQEITRGRYQSVSEVVRAGLRNLEKDESRLQMLRDKLQAGEKSALIKDFNSKEFIAGLHKKHIK